MLIFGPFYSIKQLPVGHGTKQAVPLCWIEAIIFFRKSLKATSARAIQTLAQDQNVGRGNLKRIFNTL